MIPHRFNEAQGTVGMLTDGGLNGTSLGLLHRSGPLPQEEQDIEWLDWATVCPRPVTRKLAPRFGIHWRHLTAPVGGKVESASSRCGLECECEFDVRLPLKEKVEGVFCTLKLGEDRAEMRLQTLLRVPCGHMN